MKKIILILSAMLLIPVVAFAQVAVGGIAFAKSPLLFGEAINSANTNVNQFCFGGNVRLKANWLQLESVIVASTGPVNGIDIYADAGVTFDVAMVRLSAGLGPNLSWNFGTQPIVQTGMNGKIGADVMLGDISVGASYIMALKYNDHVDLYNRSGLLGFQVLVWL
jgi:hypothetical protein